MSVLNRIAHFQNRRDEVPNQELARDLAKKKDRKGIREIAENLWNNDRNVQADCLKVLYEVGYIDPGLVAAYAEDFIKLLKSKNNRLVWGGMIGLSTVAELKADVVLTHLDEVEAGHEGRLGDHGGWRRACVGARRIQRRQVPQGDVPRAAQSSQDVPPEGCTAAFGEIAGRRERRKQEGVRGRSDEAHGRLIRLGAGPGEEGRQAGGGGLGVCAACATACQGANTMRDLLLVVLAYLLQPVRWLLPGNLTIPLVLWLIAFVIAVATLIWLLRRAIRLIRDSS